LKRESEQELRIYKIRSEKVKEGRRKTHALKKQKKEDTNRKKSSANGLLRPEGGASCGNSCGNSCGKANVVD
jgi:hypothetical protein